MLVCGVGLGSPSARAHEGCQFPAQGPQCGIERLGRGFAHPQPVLQQGFVAIEDLQQQKVGHLCGLARLAVVAAEPRRQRLRPQPAQAMWVNVARLVRGQVLSIRELEYIEATRVLGFSHFRTIFRHILPNIMGPVLVIAASNFASAIVIEAGLSFLGVGVQPPQPSWGLMIKENYSFIITQNPMLALAPGFAIMLLVLAFNLLGNGLRDALDVK